MNRTRRQVLRSLLGAGILAATAPLLGALRPRGIESFEEAPWSLEEDIWTSFQDVLRQMEEACFLQPSSLIVSRDVFVALQKEAPSLEPGNDVGFLGPSFDGVSIWPVDPPS